MRVLISGSSGFIGSPLVRHLRASGHTVTRLVRSTSTGEDSSITWDPERGEINTADLGGFDAAIHLGGENMANRRWSQAQKDRIHNSRIDSARILTEALLASPNPPSIFICASASGYYGDRGDEVLTEESEPGTDFLSGSTVAWERATDGIASAGVRVCNLRFGLVLGASGGVLQRLLPIFRLGLGGRLSSGRQYTSWISRRDVVRAIDHVMVNGSISGPVNVSSPVPVTNSEFTSALAKAVRRPALFIVPRLALRIMQGEVTDAVLSSVRMQPSILTNSGFEFDHPDIASALAWALNDR
ncbi:MAG: TIGR01777 family oxidoreductase [SAR202 cluster bacterium]|nr:TIGR01777 family oxidoreductase [SAR202 cluster bacterium]